MNRTFTINPSHGPSHLSPATNRSQTSSIRSGLVSAPTHDAHTFYKELSAMVPRPSARALRQWLSDVQ